MKANLKNTEFENNISKGSPIKDFVKYFIGANLIFILIVISFLGASSLLVELIPNSIEVKIHNKIYSSYHSSYKQGPKELKVQKLLDELIVLSDMKDKKFQIRIIKTPIENAFAKMGGKIVLYEGLLEKIKTENSLSLVLAHELGHYHLRHHLSGVGSAAILGVTTFVIPNYLEVVESVLFNSIRCGVLKYSRENEMKSDKYALSLVIKKYSSLSGALQYFENLSENTKSNKVGKYFLTHPLPKERLAYFKKESLKYSTQEVIPYSYE